jgi:hypothetical protein
MNRRLIAACVALTLAGVPLLAQQRADANTVGIKVHGHWTIDVRKADGTLVSHNEFENALTSDGGAGISQILSGAWTAGSWGILLDGNVCLTTASVGATWHSPSCLILNPAIPAGTQSNEDSRDLSITVPSANQPNAGSLVLKGSVRAPNAGEITAVRTRQAACLVNNPSIISPAACQPAVAIFDTIVPNIFDVTSRTLATPIAVEAGQFIQVTVVLSFS